MDHEVEQALQHLNNETASAAEIDLLRQKLATKQISIGGDVNNSVIILGNGNTVIHLTPEMVDVLTRRKLSTSVPLRDPIVEGINLLPYDYDQKIQNFLREYLGDEKHPVPFGGRDEALGLLADWLTGSAPYLLLAAQAGRGKSALLVRWLDSLRTRDDLALAFVPISIRFGTNMERVFYASLAARLAFLHGDDVPTSSETSTAVYRGRVSDYLSKPLANGKTLVVVLDGLDEASDWQAGPIFCPLRHLSGYGSSSRHASSPEMRMYPPGYTA
ncbi:MAG: ATP-binding protein [Nitrospira sp.]